MELSYVYIHRCSNGIYYTGVTSNLDKSLREHRTKAEKKCIEKCLTAFSKDYRFPLGFSTAFALEKLLEQANTTHFELSQWQALLYLEGVYLL